MKQQHKKPLRQWIKEILIIAAIVVFIPSLLWLITSLSIINFVILMVITTPLIVYGFHKIPGEVITNDISG